MRSRDCNTVLFVIERDIKEKTTEERYAIRKERSKPILDAYLVWLCKQRARTLPKSAVGQAIAYSLNQWEKLTSFLEDGCLEMGNNRVKGP
ncbi:hypothetical protein YSY22_52220 [Brevibacillus formosus]